VVPKSTATGNPHTSAGDADARLETQPTTRTGMPPPTTRRKNHGLVHDSFEPNTTTNQQPASQPASQPTSQPARQPASQLAPTSASNSQSDGDDDRRTTTRTSRMHAHTHTHTSTLQTPWVSIPQQTGKVEAHPCAHRSRSFDARAAWEIYLTHCRRATDVAPRRNRPHAGTTSDRF
jgi:hypothetical protein